MRPLRIVLPKGRIFENIKSLFTEAGISLITNGRSLFPMSNHPELEFKIMKPQNIPQLVELGAHDCGFTGFDWITETGSRVEEIMDLGLDPVSIVAAMPRGREMVSVPENPLMVASEYEVITRSFLEQRGIPYVFIRSFGATEAFPPDDADMIVDNMASGKTLRDHNLEVKEVIVRSSTRFITNERTLADAARREQLEMLRLLFTSILDARQRMMMEMNVPQNRLEAVVNLLPAMRTPTVASLHDGSGYAVKAAVKKDQVPGLIGRLKELDVSDILVYDIKKVVL